jgi:hypothetical protein
VSHDSDDGYDVAQAMVRRCGVRAFGGAPSQLSASSSCRVATTAALAVSAACCAAASTAAMRASCASVLAAAAATTALRRVDEVDISQMNSGSDTNC